MIESEEENEKAEAAKKGQKGRKGAPARLDLLGEMRKLFWIILICAMVIMPLAVWGTHKISEALQPNPYPVRAVGVPPGTVIDRDFSLTDQRGKTVTGAQYSSRAWAVFFGFTHCPDVCPVTLSRLSSLWGQIQNKDRIQLFFVSVDPARDTPEVLADYMKNFDPNFIALTGEEVKIEDLKKKFGAYSKIVQEQGNPDYSVDHSATVYLLRADGVFAGTIDMDETDASIIGKLKYLTGG